LGLEFVVAAVAVYVISSASSDNLATHLTFPFFKDLAVNLGIFFIPFGAFVIVGAGNAVNMTDGLDGLAIVPVMIAAGSFGVIAYLSGNAIFAEYLQITNVKALGGMLGATAVATKHEIVLAIIGGLFVVEALSVIIQVASFKLTGKRVFRMAPIHHHYEQLGWTESQIVVRFWIISVILALIGLATLKLR